MSLFINYILNSNVKSLHVGENKFTKGLKNELINYNYYIYTDSLKCAASMYTCISIDLII